MVVSVYLSVVMVPDATGMAFSHRPGNPGVLLV